MTPISALSRDLVHRACGEGCNFPECACIRAPSTLAPVPADVAAAFRESLAEQSQRFGWPTAEEFWP